LHRLHRWHTQFDVSSLLAAAFLDQIRDAFCTVTCTNLVPVIR
jgi:hypothetical protein